ncbi:MAG: hypothetical protein ACI9NN_002002 [Bacteroidia bacterium]|jgi:hypothetical protein
MIEITSFGKTLMTSLIDIVTGGEEAQKSFGLGQKLKSQTYQSMLQYWSAVVNHLGETPYLEFEEEDKFLSSTDAFYLSMVNVYKQFEHEVSYNKGGVFENVANKMGEIFHKNVFAGFDPAIKELEYEFAQFWDHFFRLKGNDEEKYETTQIEVIIQYISNLAAKSVKDNIAHGVSIHKENAVNDEEHDGKKRGFSIEHALNDELNTYEDLFIDVDIAKEAAKNNN